MESIQSYYLYKDRMQTIERERTQNIAISWLIEAMKNVLGYEDIRQKIIKHFVPNIENLEHMRTFDAFQQYNTEPYLDKTLEIIEYCENVILDENIKGKIIMTASNIQQSVDDIQTHYQTFIINKENKHVYAVDPAFKKKGKGIYDPTISKKVVFPIFRSHGYTCEFVPLSQPAQTNKNDVFCQTWSLLIAVKVIEQYGDFDCIEIPSIREKAQKYQMLLDFYKRLLNDCPSIKRELDISYLELTTKNRDYISQYCPFKTIREINTYKMMNNLAVEDIMM